MPREGVPYPERLLCSIRCELKNIWSALTGKLHSINGVEGDGQGNVTIVSENAAITVNDYPLSNQIGIDLDTSLLPAAAVDSVCGKTGTVVLYAQDIGGGVVPGVTVRNELTTLAGDNYQNAQDILAEATARANADSTLQTNINAVQASIPTEVVNALAADTTIVRTSGNQNIGDVKTVNTQATGSYSQQIANSQKVKNELDNYTPMLRTSGNQAAAGNKYLNAVTYIGNVETASSTKYSLIADLGAVANANMVIVAVSRGGASIGALSVSGTGIPTWQGIGITGSTSLGIAIKDSNMYLAAKRTGSTGQNYTINIIGVTKGTAHYNIVPYEGNAPTDDVDSYTEATRI